LVESTLDKADLNRGRGSLNDEYAIRNDQKAAGAIRGDILVVESIGAVAELVD
jgi:hypothetical protein